MRFDAKGLWRESVGSKLRTFLFKEKEAIPQRYFPQMYE